MAMMKKKPAPDDAPVKFRLAPPGWRWRAIHIIPFFTDLISVLLVAYLPVLIGTIIDLHTAGETQRAWSQMKWAVLIVLYFCFNEIFTWGITFTVVAALERAWRTYVGRLVFKSSGQEIGNLIALMNKDSRTMAALWQPMILASSAVGATAMGTYQLWKISPVVAVIVLVGLIVTLFALTRISKVIEKHSEIFRDKVGVNTSKASDIASAIRTILGLGAGPRMMRRYTHSAEDLYESQLRLERVQTWSFAARDFLVGTVTLLAIAFALRGTLAEGTWLADTPAGQLVSIAGLINVMTGPIWSVEMLLFAWRNARVAFKRVDQLVHDNESAPVDTHRAASPVASVKIPDSTQTVVFMNPRDMNLTAQECAEALVHQLRSQSSGGKDRERVLLSEPNPMIFAGTLQEHVQLGTDVLDDQHIIELLRLTDSLEIAYRLGGKDPAQYLQASISAEGANLSGGQRQRLALARALAQDATTLVLTEPLNSVDEPSQKYIFDHLEQKCARDYPLENIRKIYVVSTTMEAERRIATQHRSDHHNVAAHSVHHVVEQYEEAITSSLQKIEQTPMTSQREIEQEHHRG